MNVRNFAIMLFGIPAFLHIKIPLTGYIGFKDSSTAAATAS